jgi:coenzyme F420-0:L-glutamate ligase/coenzyme F420-1:gamma-L-glutamate ligase
VTGIQVLPLEGMPEIEEGADLAGILAEAAERFGGLENGDVLVVV